MKSRGGRITFLPCVDVSSASAWEVGQWEMGKGVERVKCKFANKMTRRMSNHEVFFMTCKFANDRKCRGDNFWRTNDISWKF